MVVPASVNPLHYTLLQHATKKGPSMTLTKQELELLGGPSVIDLAAAARMDSLDAACAHVQNLIGQDAGDIAAHFFSGFDDAQGDWLKSTVSQRLNWLKEYLELETALAGELMAGKEGS
jgi:hypothetical protein